MASPISIGKPALIVLDDDFEETTNIIKSTINEVVDQTSEKIKQVLKEQANASLEVAIPFLTYPIKASLEVACPAPLATVLNKSIEVSCRNVSQRVSNNLITKCVDVRSKQIVTNTVDDSARSLKSIFSKSCNS